MKALLKPFELTYRGVNRIRRALYRKGWLSSSQLPRPVISIGNLSVGGSGKTPTVIAVARHFLSKGKKVAVLTRGYRREGGEEMAIVDSEDARRFGDEPVLLERSLKSASIVVGSDRYAAGLAFLENHDCDLFLLDDGFQHLRLWRDLDIVIHHPGALWLREGLSSIRNADILLLRGEGAEEWTGRTGIPSFEIRLRPAALVIDGREHPVSDLAGKRIAVFSGLADNQQFFTLVEKLGANVVNATGFRDHHFYSDSEMNELRRAAKSASGEMLVTTEKDWVRIPMPDVAFLRVEMEILPASEFSALLDEELAAVEREPAHSK